MSKTLLEANFQTVDLQAIYNRKAQPEADDSNSTEPAKSSQTIMSDEELEKLLIEEKNIEPDIAKKIVAFGDPLKKAIKILGTNTSPEKGSNPLLAFVIQDYVKTKLIVPGLLNAETFKAIYNAVAQKLVANKEFFSPTAGAVNDYNIIYCPDWYKKTLTEMMKYLKLQNKVEGLTPNNRALNKKIFFNDENAKASEAKLNSLDAAYKVAGVKEETNSETDEQKTKDTSNISKFLNSLTSPSEWFAVLNYLSTKVDADEISIALQNDKFKSLTGEAITKASQKVFPKLKNIKISKDTARLIASLITNKLG